MAISCQDALTSHRQKRGFGRKVGVKVPIGRNSVRRRRMFEGDRYQREIPVDPAILQELAEDRGLWHQPHEETADDQEPNEKARQRAEAISILSTLVETRLTKRQKEIVILHFHEDKTQAEIAEILGISQQVVSKQLFGVMRAGKKIGGAIKQLRRALEEQDISFE